MCKRMCHVNMCDGPSGTPRGRVGTFKEITTRVIFSNRKNKKYFGKIKIFKNIMQKGTVYRRVFYGTRNEENDIKITQNTIKI